MTEFARNSSVKVAIQRETVLGTPATDAPGSALILRITDSPGLSLKRTAVASAEKRADAQKPMGRLASRSVDGSYNGEFTVGGAVDLLFESIMRGTWTATQVISEATMTSITTTTSTIVAAAGSWLTQGVRVGDVVYLSGHSTAANNGILLRVTAVSALTLTVAGTPLTANAVADTAFSLNILKKLKTPDAPLRYSHTVEQYDPILDRSELFVGCRLTGLSMSFKPGAMATFVATFMGLDRKLLVTGTSPYFTDPVRTTGLSLLADDGAVRYNGADVAYFTGFDLNFQITANGVPVIGSTVSPDIFDDDLAVSGTITALRKDFTSLEMFDAETEFDLSILLSEPSGTPRPSFGLYLSRVKISQPEAQVGGGDGAKVETLTLMVGPKDATTGYDGGTATFFSTGA